MFQIGDFQVGSLIKFTNDEDVCCTGKVVSTNPHDILGIRDSKNDDFVYYRFVSEVKLLANFEAFKAIFHKAHELGLPCSYREDLTKIDREFLKNSNEGLNFVWSVRHSGTRLATFENLNDCQGFGILGLEMDVKANQECIEDGRAKDRHIFMFRDGVLTDLTDDFKVVNPLDNYGAWKTNVFRVLQDNEIIGKF